MRLVRRFVEVFRTDGVASAVSKVGPRVRFALKQRRWKRSIPRVAKGIKALDTSVSIPHLLDLIWTTNDGIIRPTQDRWELESFLQMMLDQGRPKVVVEIGTALGGTLCAFCRLADPQALIVSIDLPYGPFGGGYQEWRVPLYMQFAQAEQNLVLLRADSHSEATLRTLKEILDGRQIDLLFIDGDHTLEGVTRDYDMYKKFVRPGALIAFHDVAVHQESSGCHVHDLWAQLRAKPGSAEFIRDANQGWAGIGVLIA